MIEHLYSVVIACRSRVAASESQKWLALAPLLSWISWLVFHFK